MFLHFNEFNMKYDHGHLENVTAYKFYINKPTINFNKRILLALNRCFKTRLASG